MIGYACQCSNGYNGKNCEIKPDYCKHDPCQNEGLCANTPDGNYTCTCKDGFKGRRCENTIGIKLIWKSLIILSTLKKMLMSNVFIS